MTILISFQSYLNEARKKEKLIDSVHKEVQRT